MNIYVALLAFLLSFVAGLIIGAALWWTFSQRWSTRKGESHEDYVLRMAAEQPVDKEVVFEGKKRIQ